MSRVWQVARCARGLAILAWWAPAIALALAALLLDRGRFGLAIGIGRGLAGVGAVGAARAVFRHEAARCERRRRVIAGRQGQAVEP